MSKAKQFIKDCTRSCSNETTPVGSFDHTYHEWLTPEQALAAVEIAKEEMIDTLEVKEVDLEKELKDWLGERVGKWTGEECERMCLYFFELGLKTKGG